MRRGFEELFKAKDQRLEQNRLELRLEEAKSKKKLEYLKDIPLDLMSERERYKLGRLDVEKKELVLVVPLLPAYGRTGSITSYTYLPPPALPVPLHLHALRLAFASLLELLRSKLHLHDSFRFLFDRNGKRISNLFDFLTVDHLYFFASSASFSLSYIHHPYHFFATVATLIAHCLDSSARVWTCKAEYLRSIK